MLIFLISWIIMLFGLVTTSCCMLITNFFFFLLYNDTDNAMITVNLKIFTIINSQLKIKPIKLL